jgi:glutamate-1-semialdehyde aminotransferase
LKEDEEALTEFALRLRLEGVFIPAPLHLAFVSPAHTDEDIDEVVRALCAAADATFN